MRFWAAQYVTVRHEFIGGRALAKSHVFAKKRIRGTTVSRTESPGFFAIVIAVYTILGIAPLTVF